MDIDQFQARLKAMQAEIIGLNEMIKDTTAAVELDQNRVGRLSRMDAMQGQAMAKASTSRQKQQLRLINQALVRIEQGSFGYCLECDELIAIKRLEIDPAASYCIDCAQAFE